MLEIEELMGRDPHGRGGAIIADNVLTKLLRLAQVTSGFAVLRDLEAEAAGIGEAESRHIRYFDGCPKLADAVERIAQLKPNEKAIVWCCFVPMIPCIAEALRQAGLDAVEYYGGLGDKAREEAERRFNSDPACRAIVATAAAGGEGTNWRGYSVPEDKTNCCLEIFYAQNWSVIQRSQAEDRAHRAGTRVSVEILDLQVPGTIDQEIRERVATKREEAENLQDVRGILERLKKIMSEDDAEGDE